ncbi:MULTISPECIES: helix-turn-helix domain-containing protein [Paenibacillus]|uniref:helix-turn-helix domain-containing protein n=1 Tax=Paenibacillus TaxID=44249 RepID=UPI002023E8DC|nr:MULTISPECIES: helix-turn-helix transcriptional regulator [Paenibacillus]MCP3797597.1 helix-turn-helix domain-containing protein [Paenibacillus sp. CH40]URJ38999.1 helix-turn-helix transcriptional regulator [Paenibacillus polymyxa]
MSTIGQRIRTIRKTNNLNQIKFANIIGISQGTLSELEQDKYRPSLDIIIANKENFNFPYRVVILWRYACIKEHYF